MVLQAGNTQIGRHRRRRRRRGTPACFAGMTSAAGPGWRIEPCPGFPGGSGCVCGGEHAVIIARTMYGHNTKRRKLKGCVPISAPYSPSNPH
jgi:hypothetical protein